MTAILAALIFLLPLVSLSVFGRQHGGESVLEEAGASLLLIYRLGQSLWRGQSRFGPWFWLPVLLLEISLCAVLATHPRLAHSEYLQISAGIIVCGTAAQITDSGQIKRLLDALIGLILLVTLAWLFTMLFSLPQNSAALTDQNRHVVWNGATHLGRLRTQSSEAASPAHTRVFLSTLPALSFVPICLPLLIAIVCAPTALKRRLGACAAALASLGMLVLTVTWPVNWITSALLAVLLATGLCVLRRLPAEKTPPYLLRTYILLGTMGSAAVQVFGAFPLPASFFFWLLLGLGAASGGVLPSILRVSAYCLGRNVTSPRG